VGGDQKKQYGYQYSRVLFSRYSGLEKSLESIGFTAVFFQLLQVMKVAHLDSTPLLLL
jgi:hypothetical protein